MPEAVCKKLDMYIMAPELFSAACFINPSHQSVCISSPNFARQRLGKHVLPATNTSNSSRIVGRVVIYAASVVSKESRRLVLPGTSCLL
jgi:hypothetical protein